MHKSGVIRIASIIKKKANSQYKKYINAKKKAVTIPKSYSAKLQFPSKSTKVGA